MSVLMNGTKRNEQTKRKGTRGGKRTRETNRWKETKRNEREGGRGCKPTVPRTECQCSMAPYPMLLLPPSLTPALLSDVSVVTYVSTTPYTRAARTLTSQLAFRSIPFLGFRRIVRRVSTQASTYEGTAGGPGEWRRGGGVGGCADTEGTGVRTTRRERAGPSEHGPYSVPGIAAT